MEIVNIFASPAYAQSAGGGAAGAFTGLIPIFLIFGIEALRRGDQVVTQGGVFGKVTKVNDDDSIEVEIAKDVKVRVVKTTIVSVRNKTEPTD